MLLWSLTCASVKNKIRTGLLVVGSSSGMDDGAMKRWKHGNAMKRAKNPDRCCKAQPQRVHPHLQPLRRKLASRRNMKNLTSVTSANWEPPSDCPITTDPEFPEEFRWEQIDGLLIAPPADETPDEYKERLAKNLDLYEAAADEYSERVERFIKEREAKEAASTSAEDHLARKDNGKSKENNDVDRLDSAKKRTTPGTNVSFEYYNLMRFIEPSVESAAASWIEPSYDD